MCDPLTIIGGGLMVGSQIAGGITAEGNARLEAGDLEYQAAVERDNSLMAAQQIRREGRRARGEVVTSIAGSGVKVGEGSALDAEREVMQNSETDALLAILRGDQSSRQLKANAENVRRAGRQARRAANINAVTSLLSMGAQSARASGWRANGPGFSGQQKPAPVIDKSTRY